VNAPAKQRLANIDVAKASNDPLVEEQQLDGRRSPGEAPPQLSRIEIERLGPQRLERGPFGQLVRGDEVDRTEASRVVERQARSLVGFKQQVVVLLKLQGIDPPASRHSKVKHHRVVSIGMDQPIFRASAKPRHSSTGEPLAKILRKRSPQVGAPGFDTVNAAALKDMGETADGRFDFWQFRHCAAIWRTRLKPARAATRMADQVNFGDELVSPREKTRRVGEVFSSVARRYDLMNDLMSGGMHRLWKDRFVARVKPRAGEEILDMAGGTGDVAFRMSRRGARVTVSDINADMLEVGKGRAERRGLTGLTWKVENAEELSFANSAFDGYTIVFGIRNVTDIPAALGEAHRVLKRGGRFYCMEFSSSEWPGFSNLYEAYASNVIPKVGKVVANDEDSYRYLVESIRRFPRSATFKAMVAQAGFVRVSAEPMLGGLVTIHSGWKI
jgi:demethylmenaquinone methyltransferase/2-methoxy-6-polyprenyl-1,4-benzoquinol methylase